MNVKQSTQKRKRKIQQHHAIGSTDWALSEFLSERPTDHHTPKASRRRTETTFLEDEHYLPASTQSLDSNDMRGGHSSSRAFVPLPVADSSQTWRLHAIGSQFEPFAPSTSYHSSPNKDIGQVHPPASTQFCPRSAGANYDSQHLQSSHDHNGTHRDEASTDRWQRDEPWHHLCAFSRSKHGRGDNQFDKQVAREDDEDDK